MNLIIVGYLAVGVGVVWMSNEVIWERARYPVGTQVLVAILWPLFIVLVAVVFVMEISRS